MKLLFLTKILSYNRFFAKFINFTEILYKSYKNNKNSGAYNQILKAYEMLKSSLINFF